MKKTFTIDVTELTEERDQLVRNVLEQMKKPIVIAGSSHHYAKSICPLIVYEYPPKRKNKNGI